MENFSEGAPAAAPSDYVSQASFDELGLSEPVRRAIAEHGYERPTPVQVSTFRPVRDGKDVIVRSKTGTGKTAAFAIPILERIADGRRRPSALVMCPTRELAIQVAQEFTALAKHRDLSVVAVYGGASMGEQLQKLEAGAEIIVGTPGRIYDHIRRRTLKLDETMVCCLDEADEMLNMGFFEEVTRILDNLPKDCQQLLFSATVPADIEQIIRDYLTDPETILLSGDEYSVENIHNVMYPAVDAYPKPRNLLYMIEMEEPETAIVFCNTRNDTSLVAAVLNRNGYDAELLNGDLPQKERERVMAKVKRGEVRFMVATDIAARGIDISDLTHVINYSLPEDPAVFLHRVGRTGRIGKKGTSLSIVSGAEIHTLTALQKKFGIAFEEKKLPTPDEARRLWTDRHVVELKDAMSASIFEAFIPLSQELRNRPDGEYLVAFALKYFFTHHRMERAQDREKAEHKREEHERREKGEVKREGGRRETRGRDRDRERRGDRDRAGRGERAERPRAEHRERGEPAAAAPESPPLAAAPGAEARAEVEVEVSASAAEAREGRRTRRGRGARRGGPQGENGAPAPGEDPGNPCSPEGVADVAGANPEQPERLQRARIFLSLGEQDGADEARVRELLSSVAPGLEPRTIEVRRTHAFLDVAPEVIEDAVQALNGKEWGGKTLTAERARRRRR
ncbi:DEAD/DEAH box helicase [Anaeromyxobacter sp. Fw109-5]|uniref:DEAD/DEAH box helicase n=1 Tax=Anaeromyxobacter sp. (strain Fw109-5) TaxID=404589 RepID=UPI0000ED750A|nr:DEAD/DEAH box helicase [Anaeromyxobacter sp. Fw109-5]ABS26745.1 DEAD/DEAH box helicase domain protein [Anaeromyxobacter sp. Fw109-5]